MGANAEMISTNDVVGETAVHEETFAQLKAKGLYNTLVGWWLPDATKPAATAAASPASTGTTAPQVGSGSSVQSTAPGTSLQGGSGSTVQSTAPESALQGGAGTSLQGSGTVTAPSSSGQRASPMAPTTSTTTTTTGSLSTPNPVTSPPPPPHDHDDVNDGRTHDMARNGGQHHAHLDELLRRRGNWRPDDLIGHDRADHVPGHRVGSPRRQHMVVSDRLEPVE